MKPFHLIAALTLCLPSLSLSQAWAGVNTLRKVQVTDGSRIDLFFDQKVDARQIKTEFFNDIIQVSLSDVAVYPAKISSISGTELTKVFAYQYAPKLTRCRLTVKGKAESFQSRFEARASGKVLSLRIQNGSGDAITQTAARAERYNDEEKELLKKVLDSESAAQAKPAPAPTAPAAEASTEKQPLRRVGEPLAGGKPLPSPIRSFFMLGLVLAVFGAIAWIVRKAKGSSLQNHKGLKGLVGKIPGLSAKGKLIEVVATHYLGPKRSIAVVRIGGRMMVLGVTNESINLITQLADSAPEASTDALEQLAMESIEDEAPAPAAPAPAMRSGSGATSAGEPRYANPNAAKAYGSFNAALGEVSNKPSVRAQIRSRMEGMKQL